MFEYPVASTENGVILDAGLPFFMHLDLIIKELYDLDPALKTAETNFSKNNLAKGISSEYRFHKGFYEFSHCFLYTNAIEIVMIKYTVAFI